MLKGFFNEVDRIIGSSPLLAPASKFMALRWFLMQLDGRKSFLLQLNLDHNNF